LSKPQDFSGLGKKTAVLPEVGKKNRSIPLGTVFQTAVFHMPIFKPQYSCGVYLSDRSIPCAFL
jgi:hypothetical protein